MLESAIEILFILFDAKKFAKRRSRMICLRQIGGGNVFIAGCKYHIHQGYWHLV